VRGRGGEKGASAGDARAPPAAAKAGGAGGAAHRCGICAAADRARAPVAVVSRQSTAATVPKKVNTVFSRAP
jgi:hypothetical protein